jgi:hypothetical protein
VAQGGGPGELADQLRRGRKGRFDQAVGERAGREQRRRVHRQVADFRAGLARPAIAAALARTRYLDGQGDLTAEVWRERPFAVAVDGKLVYGQFDRVVLVRDPAGQPLRAELRRLAPAARRALPAADRRLPQSHRPPHRPERRPHHRPPPFPRLRRVLGRELNLATNRTAQEPERRKRDSQNYEILAVPSSDIRRI